MVNSKQVLSALGALFVLATLTACGEGGGGGGDAAVAPTFSAQPASLAVTAPATASFTVTATGTPTPTLQWQLSTNGGGTWGDIAGATSSSYTTPATVTGDSGKQYRAVATNSAGTVNSNAATLTVNPALAAPTFSAQPASLAVTAPATASFSVTATGAPTPTLQWQWSADGGGAWNDIAGATSSSYTTPATVIGDSGKQYRAVATNSAGTVNSSAATLTVRTIALPKTGQTTCYDTSVPPVAVACTTVGIPPGQDGASQTGVAEPSPRFTVDGTGACVTDSLTGLMWTQNANLPAGAGAAITGVRTWQQSLDYANNLNLCGFADWRLSNRKELRSLINHSTGNNALTLNTLGFTNVRANVYWSSSSYAGSTANAWIANFSDGGMGPNGKSNSYYVWPVRAGQ